MVVLVIFYSSIVEHVRFSLSALSCTVDSAIFPFYFIFLVFFSLILLSLAMSFFAGIMCII